MSSRYLRALAYLLVALPLILLGCDTADPSEESFFITEDLEFTFLFDENDFVGGAATTTSTSGTSINLLLNADGRGFTVDDVQSVRPNTSRNGSLVILLPTDPISNLRSATLRLDGTVIGEAAVTMTDGSEVIQLQNTSLNGLIRTSGFEASLSIELADGIQPEDYELEASFELQIEVLP